MYLSSRYIGCGAYSNEAIHSRGKSSLNDRSLSVVPSSVFHVESHCANSFYDGGNAVPRMVPSLDQTARCLSRPTKGMDHGTILFFEH